MSARVLMKVFRLMLSMVKAFPSPQSATYNFSDLNSFASARKTDSATIFPQSTLQERLDEEEEEEKEGYNLLKSLYFYGFRTPLAIIPYNLCRHDLFKMIKKLCSGSVDLERSRYLCPT